ncbi:MAG: glycosyltransferase family 4 protein [Flavobacteriia bacterium]|nr:glycosyltransferase family 4 protein [Flavobacteriia bacterium]
MTSDVSKVLILTYYWPPAGGPGVQRWLKLSKYMAEMGCEVFVVTVDESKGTYPLRDESLVSDIHPSIHVVRTDTSEQFGAYKKATGNKEVPFSGFANESDKVSFIQKVARFARGNFFVPDARRGWNNHAYSAATKLIQEHDIQYVITSSPPHSTQLVGKRLKVDFGVKWVADMRDPWTDIYYYNRFYPTAYTRRREAKMEAEVFLQADAILTVSAALKSLFASKDRNIAESKIHVLPNGFDPSDFKEVLASKESHEIPVITYAGTIGKQYPVHGLVSALENTKEKLILQIIGKWDEHTRVQLSALPNNIEVRWLDYMPKAELNSYVANSEVLLLVIPDIENNEGILTGKIFDYLGTGNPILGIGPSNGDAAVILRDSRGGAMFDYYDAEGIGNFLINLNQWKSADSSLRTQYSRREQAALVIDLLNKL